MNYENKKQEAKAVIKVALVGRRAPVVMCSYGKDSLVVLDMVRKQYERPEVLFFSSSILGEYSQKYAFAFGQIVKQGLSVYSYPPSNFKQAQYEGLFILGAEYYVDGEYFIYDTVVTTEDRYKPGEPFACAWHDYLLSPLVPAYRFKWDVVFTGSKEADRRKYVLPCIAKMAGQGTMLQGIKGGIIANPLWNWSDADVWEYIEEHGLEFHRERYEGNPHGIANTGRAGAVSIDHNPTCWDCLDYRRAGKPIVCPKSGELVPFRGYSREEHMKALESMRFPFPQADAFLAGEKPADLYECAQEVA